MTDEKYEELMSMPATDLVDYVMKLEMIRDASPSLFCQECRGIKTQEMKKNEL